MLFAVTCIDKPGHAHVRAENRPAHLDFLKANAAAVKLAGPFLSDDGQGMVGSLLVIKAADRAALDAMVAQDPYAAAGLFESVTVRPWRWTIGNPG
jgi:uncharacterized protein YciI